MENFSFSLFEIDEKKKKKTERIFSSDEFFFFSFTNGFFKIRKGGLFSQKIKIFLGHKKVPFVFFFTQNAKIIISCSVGGSIKIWENLSQRVIRTIRFKNKYFQKIICHQKINILIILCSGGITLLDYKNGKTVVEIPFYSRSDCLLNFIEPGNIFVIESLDKALNFFDINQKIFFRKIKFSKFFSPVWVSPFSPFNLFFCWKKTIFQFNFDGRLESVFFKKKTLFLERKFFSLFQFYQKQKIFSETFLFSFFNSYSIKKITDKKTRLMVQ